jgi:hypothetical protein
VGNPTVSRPFLTQPWEAGVTGWIVVFGAVVAELAGGIATSRSTTTAVMLALGIPVVIVLGFAVAQWWQARSAGVEPASWWHLLAVAGALFVWLLWPTAPGVLGGAAGSATAACGVLPTTQTAQCLPIAAQALASHNLAWWGTAALIVLTALLARHSRIAAWATIPIAFAGCQLASHFLQMLLTRYNAG